MDTNSQVLAYLKKQEASAPAELKAYFPKFTTLYERRLWHELTLELMAYSAEPAAAAHLLDLFANFVSDWSGRMNQLLFVKFVALASRQIKNPAEALAFVETQRSKLKDAESARDAYIYATIEAAHHTLQIPNKLDETKALIDEAEKTLDSLPKTDVATNACFYRVSADYYKVKMMYPQYYHNALLYLSSIQLENLSQTEREGRGFELALSALLGEGLYNFGELLQQGILDSLKGSQYQWISELLVIISQGRIAEFNKAIGGASFKQQQLLVAAEPLLRQKLCIMALMNVVTSRSKESRGSMSFVDISKETAVPQNEVEHLVMKAFGLGLVKGRIDEVDQLVQFSWVQPRTLSSAEIIKMAENLGDWSEKVLEIKQKAVY